jgi:hypothetical protein
VNKFLLYPNYIADHELIIRESNYGNEFEVIEAVCGIILNIKVSTF